MAETVPVLAAVNHTATCHDAMTCPSSLSMLATAAAPTPAPPTSTVSSSTTSGHSRLADCDNSTATIPPTSLVRTEGVQQKLQQAIDSSDPATATAAFLAAIHTIHIALDGAQPTARRPSASSPAPADASWFTEECRQLRREYLRQLYRHPTSRVCREARRAYKACVRRCKGVAAAEAADLLKHLLSGDPRQFWQLVKGRSTRWQGSPGHPAWLAGVHQAPHGTADAHSH
jgi:hypothetical protein